MIDICCVIYRNYKWLDLQLEYLPKVMDTKNFRLLICDNTPRHARRGSLENPLGSIFYMDIDGCDGTTHGAALDLLVHQATSEIVCTIDSDFFFLRRGILDYVQEQFNAGKVVLGTACSYGDWDRIVNPLFPERHSNLAPGTFGQFLLLENARQQTFIVTSEEAFGGKYMETGWRLRRRMIEENWPREVWPAFVKSNQEDAEWRFFGTEQDKPFGVHILKGSFAGARNLDYDTIKVMLNREING